MKTAKSEWNKMHDFNRDIENTCRTVLDNGNIHDILTEARKTKTEQEYSAFCYNLFYASNMPSRDELDIQKETVFSVNPKISLVVPVYNTDETYLTVLLDSVCAQTYRYWELCVADGNSSNPRLREIIESYAKNHNNIKYVFLNENKGISENTNAAIALSDGDYIAFADHDDILAPNALFEVVKTLNENGDAGLIYTDHVLIDTKNTVGGFAVKSDWSHISFFLTNYIVHLVVIRRGLVFSAGLLNKDYDYFQDSDLILKIAEKPGRILHIPKILYYWRQHDASVSSKQAEIDNGVVTDSKERHLNRMGVKWDKGLVSIIIQVSGDAEITKRLVENSLRKIGYSNIEVIVLYSRYHGVGLKQYCSALRRGKLFKVISCALKPEDLTDSVYFNLAAKECRGSYIVFIKNNIEISTDFWIRDFAHALTFPKTAFVGGKLNVIDDGGGFLYASGGEYIGNEADIKTYSMPVNNEIENFIIAPYCRNVSSLIKGLTAIKREIFEKLGGFDESFPYYFYLTDLCLKASQSGYNNILTKSIVSSYKIPGGPETGDFNAELSLFEERWDKLLKKGDPYLNPNLSVINYEKYGCPFKLSAR